MTSFELLLLGSRIVKVFKVTQVISETVIQRLRKLKLSAIARRLP